MVVYRHQKKAYFKWILALIIFILAMTVTFSEVYGIHVPAGCTPYYQESTSTGTVVLQNLNNSNCLGGASTGLADMTSMTNLNDASHTRDSQQPSGVPEPGTLMLLGTGLAAMYALRRKKIL
ncbi:MAG: PEP-CTERM sorting domain-containing protein [candidate division Zixibacteria bacterium]|nr:PEP-CTERM sorting domain-containing protein [candidate division Zixibacteria bacterium]